MAEDWKLMKRLPRLHKLMMDSFERRYGLTGNEITREDFVAKGMAAWQEGPCPYCGDTLTVKSISPDHVFPLFLGGSCGSHNIQFVCIECNMEKGFLPVDVYLETHPETRVGQPRLRHLGREYFAEEMRRQQRDRSQRQEQPGTERLFVKRLRR